MSKHARGAIVSLCAEMRPEGARCPRATGHGAMGWGINKCRRTRVAEAWSLLDRAQAGDCEAFGQICRTYETRLLRQAMTLCGNEALAEDLAQDTLVEAWKCLRRYNGRCQFFTWLCAILLHRYRNAFRKNRLLAGAALSGQDRADCAGKFEGLTDRGAIPDEGIELRE